MTQPPDRRLQDAAGEERDISGGGRRVADAAGRGTAEVHWPGEANAQAEAAQGMVGWPSRRCVPRHRGSGTAGRATGSSCEPIACNMQFGRRVEEAQTSPAAKGRPAAVGRR